MYSIVLNTYICFFSSHKIFLLLLKLDKIILAKWFNMMDAGNVFKYKLDALDTRVCSGKHFSLSLSLSLSLSHTHTHTHTHIFNVSNALHSTAIVRALKHYSSTTYKVYYRSTVH